MYYILIIIVLNTNPTLAIASVYKSYEECSKKENEFKIVYPTDKVKCIQIEDK